MNARVFLALLIVSATVLAAAEAQLPVTPSEPERIFQVRGVVEEIRTTKNEVDIRHDEIPGYMQAMSMPFKVRDAGTLASLKPGQVITFRLVVTREEDWLERPVVIREPPTTGAPAPVTEARLIALGEPLPDAAFTDHLGKPLTLGQYRGRVVAITFIFTRCPLPTACPLLSRRFAEAQVLLAERHVPSDPQLLSITIDPAHDTSEVLRMYAAGHGADPARWRFAHAPAPELTAFASRCGLGFWHADGTVRHNLRTLVIDRAGIVRAIYEDGRWTAADLVAALDQAAIALATPAAQPTPAVIAPER